LDNPKPVRLAGSEGGRFPFWSPDSRSIGYHQGVKVVRARLDGGGAPQTLYAGSSSALSHWARDEEIYISLGTAVGKLHPSTGQVSRVVSVDSARGELSFHRPYLLPNGKLLLSIRTNRPGESGVYLISPAIPNERKLLVVSTYFDFAGSRLFWGNGDSQVARRLDLEKGELTGEQETVSAMLGVEATDRIVAHGGSNLALRRANVGAGLKLVWIDRAGRAGSEIARLGSPHSFRMSPDGAQLSSFRRVSGQNYLHVRPAKGGAWNRLTFQIGSVGFRVWSPNSKYVLFQSAEFQIAGKASDGSGPEELITKPPGRQWPTDWSKDGSTVLYYEFDAKTQRDIRYMPVGETGKPDPSKARVYLQTPANEYYGRFSPEARPRWIAYVSDETGRDEVYMQGFPEARGKWQISTVGGRFPEWNPNGKEIFYMGDDSMLRAVSVRLSDTAVSVGKTTKLFPLSNEANSSYDVGPDGNRFLVRAPVDERQAPLEVIINWPGLLGKR